MIFVCTQNVGGREAGKTKYREEAAETHSHCTLPSFTVSRFRFSVGALSETSRMRVVVVGIGIQLLHHYGRPGLPLSPPSTALFFVHSTSLFPLPRLCFVTLHEHLPLTFFHRVYYRHPRCCLSAANNLVASSRNQSCIGAHHSSTVAKDGQGV
jgi:hypothetical protein